VNGWLKGRWPPVAGRRVCGLHGGDAPVQEGRAVARNVLAVIDGGETRSFRYKPIGQLVEMGSSFAVNQVMSVKFSGLLASLFWRATSTSSKAHKAAPG
jgi:NADH dehydrogenase FAD-containing subunit